MTWQQGANDEAVSGTGWSKTNNSGCVSSDWYTCAEDAYNETTV